jgi:GT2 family glycosyltransferase
MLRSEFPEVAFVQAGANLGFARGNNFGVTFSKGGHLLFLNPDTEVRGTALSALASIADADPGVGIVGPCLLNSDGSIQIESTRAYPTIVSEVLESRFLQIRFPRLNLWGIRPLFSGATTPSSVDVVSGACLFIKRDVFERVGGFSDRYFMYSEDIDLCWKVKKAGWSVIFAPQAKVVHHGGGSSALAPVSQFVAVLSRESRLRFFKYSRGAVYSTIYRYVMAVTALCRLILLLVAYPILRIARASNAGNSIRKWSHVFKWAVGLESWAGKIA